ncbi:hypothetical protein Q4485_12805 [Granulosicoccaceae sp. 1_MG-2023]|nr:hypothetical protein [Granulosicoccaceae sp. 1_MG-2023]
MDYFINFRWAVPHVFADALAECRFEEGDIFYESRDGYSQTGTKHPDCHFIQILKNLDKNADSDGAFRAGWNSLYEIVIYNPGGVRAEKITSTGGRLYTVLWKGDLTVLNHDAPPPREPVVVKGGAKKLQRCRDWFEKRAGGRCGFVMYRDLGSTGLRTKFIKLSISLLRSANSSLEIYDPREVGFPDAGELPPTAEIAAFWFGDQTRPDIEQRVKRVVYHRAKSSKNDRFRIAAHGLLI